MRKLLSLLLVGIFVGCGPSEGDIYENMLTGDRYKIDIGECEKMADTQKSLNKKFEKHAKEKNMDVVSMIEEGLLMPVIERYDKQDPSSSCISYEVDKRRHNEHVGYFNSTTVYIENEKDFLEEHKKVN